MTFDAVCCIPLVTINIPSALAACSTRMGLDVALVAVFHNRSNISSRLYFRAHKDRLVLSI